MTAISNKFSFKNIKLDSRLRITTLAFVVASLCYLAAKLAGLLTVGVPETEFPLWPGCAVLAAILLLLPRKLWPIILAAGLAGFVFYDLEVGMRVLTIVGLILADAVEVLVSHRLAAPFLGHARHPGPLWGRLVATVLSGQQASCER